MSAQDRAWRATGWRWCKFSLVGAAGILVQLGTLALLTAAGVNYLLATALAVEVAVLHNFAWHQNFTWDDREDGILGRLARFHVTNGAISIVGNLALMRLLVGAFAMPPIPANLASIAVCSMANFFAADRIVFLARGREGCAPSGSCGDGALPRLAGPKNPAPQRSQPGGRRPWASPMSSTVRREKGT